MGVPKFFRFISERYPCLSQLIKEYEIPEFDNFYIDANGIIHSCSHPDDSVNFRMTEKEMFQDIFYYIEVLFRLIQPKKLFFIAIDGVAPRAKMNQQRCRRFKNAKEVELATQTAIEKGLLLPNSDPFDSNCITPGTVFMDRLHKQLQYFIKLKISTDELWQKPKIILSGHNVPGEGEHKIMDYIRYLRSQSDWDPNTRHCLNGLDADLIILGLCTHEPNFAILREEVTFTRNPKKPRNAEETKFYLLHLSMLRGYLDLEFQSLKNKLPFEYDIERIIDDWVLMGFLVGNDFIPNLPKFQIANNDLDKLYQAYIDIVPTLGGYINDYGTLNLDRFEKYLSKLAEIELEAFRGIQADIKYLESKSGNTFSDDFDETDCKFDDDLLLLVEGTNKLLESFGNGAAYDSSDEEGLIQEEFKDYKTRFYKTKLNYENVDSEVLKSQAECYVRAIQWNLHYYYTGCPSWSWFYPQHYAPYVSDIKGLTDFDLKFDKSTPFQPFQQLLAVLPAASKKIVPEVFRNLMASPDSPIIDFYPTEFETDLNDKKHDWEALVLIPFIDEEKLLNAMKPYYEDLTEEEKLRNSIQPMEIYEFTADSLGFSEAPEYFPPIEENHAQVMLLSKSDQLIDPNKVVRGILPGALSRTRLGFPQLTGIPFKAELKNQKVRVFEQPSRGENMILTLQQMNDFTEEQLYSLADKLCNKIIYVGWPHIQKGKATAVSSERCQYKIEDNKAPIKFDNKIRHEADWSSLVQRHQSNLGIELTNENLIIYVKTVEDIRNQFDDSNPTKIQGRLGYLWSETSYPFPYQTYLDESCVNTIDEEKEISFNMELSEIFPTGKRVFLLDLFHYGKLGQVKSIKNDKIVEVTIVEDPPLDLSGILDLSIKTNLRYYSGNVAAQRLGIGSHLFSRLTGCILLQIPDRDDKVNIGLGLKFTKQGEELIGFTRREGNFWYYSEKTIALVDEYMAKFPELCENIQKKNEKDIFQDKDIFPENTDEKIKEIKSWLKEHRHSKTERRPAGSQQISSEAMKEIEKRVLAYNANKTKKTKDVEVKPSNLFIPKSRIGKAPPDSNANMKLLDRVVLIRQNHCIPLGLMGTIVGIDRPASPDVALYDILFDRPVIGGTCLSCDEPRIYRLPYQTLINVSYGQRKIEKVVGSHGPNMPYPTSTGETYRSSNSGHNENKVYQWNKNREVNQSNVQGNDSVTQFIKNFNSGKGTLPANDKKLGADSEFKAMWNVLQNQKLPEEKSLRPGVPPIKEPLESADAEAKERQTNALRKLLKLNKSSGSPLNQHLVPEFQPQFIQLANNNRRTVNIPALNANSYIFNQGNVRPKTCSHINCCTELGNLCTSKNITAPLYNFNRLASSGEITCIITFFNEIGKVVGDSCSSREEAAENASCKAIKQILRREETTKSSLNYRKILQPQPSVKHPQQSVTRMGMNQQLPTPPMQWCSSKRTGGINPEMQFSPGMKKPSSRPSREQVRQSHTASSPIVLNSPREESRGSYLEVAKNDDVQSSQYNKNQQQPSKPDQGARRSAGKPKIRIAANFSVPLTDRK